MASRNFFRNIIRNYTDCPKEKLIGPELSKIKKDAAIEKFHQKAVRVTVLGADTQVGEALSLLLKQNPLVSHLYLYGERVLGVAADLEHIDTRTMATGFHESDLDKAVRRSEIIMLMGTEKLTDGPVTPLEKFRAEADRIIKLTTVCTVFAPKAFICVCVEPISYTVPLVRAIFKKTHWYHPGRIIGSVALHQIKLNSLVAEQNNLNPAGVHVPVLGGPDLDCIVPLFSRASPIGTTEDGAESLLKEFKGIPESEPPTFDLKKITFDTAPMAQGFALNRMVTTMALGMLGDQNANITGYIRSNILPTCTHLTSTLKMGPGGVIHNYGIPRLTALEMDLFEKAILLLDERDQFSQKYLDDRNEKAEPEKSVCKN